MQKDAKQNVSKFSEGPWFVYIILCDNNSLYTGITKDIERRFKAHTKGKGAKYTRMHKPVCVVHTEEYKNHSLAIKREIEIKTYPTNKKRKLHNKDIGVFL